MIYINDIYIYIYKCTLFWLSFICLVVEDVYRYM